MYIVTEFSLCEDKFYHGNIPGISNSSYYTMIVRVEILYFLHLKNNEYSTLLHKYIII